MREGYAEKVKRTWMKLIIGAILCVVSAVGVRAQEARPNGSGDTSTATSQISVDNTNPVRTTESHTKSGNRSVDKQRVELLGPNGEYQPSSETETETVQIDATTTRTVVRTYKWDGNGQRKLALVTEEDARSSASGDAQVVRTTSSSDVNGNFQVVQREVADTKKTGTDAQETKTTVYTADGNGAFTKSAQTEEVQQRSDDHTVEVKKKMLRPNGNGGWEVSNAIEKTITEDGKTRTTDERVSRPDLEGNISEYSRTVVNETETPDGKKTETVEKSSTDGPGVVNDGKQHLNGRVTTVQEKNATGETSEQRLDLPNPGNPGAGMQTTGKTTYTVLYGAAGTQKTKTIQARDGAGTFRIVGGETKKSETVTPPAPPSTAASEPAPATAPAPASADKP